jgi:hypothetical protein
LVVPALKSEAELNAIALADDVPDEVRAEYIEVRIASTRNLRLRATATWNLASLCFFYLGDDERGLSALDALLRSRDREIAAIASLGQVGALLSIAPTTALQAARLAAPHAHRWRPRYRHAWRELLNANASALPLAVVEGQPVSKRKRAR